MVLVTVFFVRLRNDAPALQLLLALAEHENVLIARPFLKRGEVKPIRSAVLVLIVDWMAGGQVPTRIPLLNECASRMRPVLIAVAIEVVAQVPGDVGERAEPVHGVANETMFILAA